MPHPTTLLKLIRRFGPEVVEELNQALLKTAVEKRVLRSRRPRVDTTVIEADVRHPTDTGLCTHAISRLREDLKAYLANRVGVPIKTLAHAIARLPRFLSTIPLQLP